MHRDHRYFPNSAVNSVWTLRGAGLVAFCLFLGWGIPCVHADSESNLQSSDFELSNESNPWPILYTIRGRYFEDRDARKIRVQIDGGFLHVNPSSRIAPFRLERLQLGICRMVSRRQGHWDSFLSSANKWDWYPHQADERNSVLLDFTPEIGGNYPIQPATVELAIPDDFDLKSSWLCSIIWNSDHSGYLPAHTGYYFSSAPRTDQSPITSP